MDPIMVPPGSSILVYPGTTVSIVSSTPPVPPPAPVALGGYALPLSPTWDQNLASGWFARYGKSPAIIHQFVPIVDTTTAPSYEKTNRALFDTAFANDAATRGAVPLFTHELRDHRVAMRTAQPQYTLDKWISGANDAPLITWLKAAGTWGRRFLYRIGWEMTGWDYTWAVNFPGNTCGKYIDFWRHVVGLQRQYAPLGEPIWCPSVLLPANAQLTPMSWCYPGTDWVRWVGLDGYITGDMNASGPNRSFADLFGPSVAELARFAPDKQVVICETGVNPAIAGTYSTDWLAAVPAGAQTMPALRGIVFFDNQASVIHNDPQKSVITTIAQDPYLAGPLVP